MWKSGRQVSALLIAAALAGSMSRRMARKSAAALLASGEREAADASAARGGHKGVSTGVAAVSLFWKHVDTGTPDLPVPTRDLLQDARQYGLVVRFDPWTHDVEPMLAEHCEVQLRRHSSENAV